MAPAAAAADAALRQDLRYDQRYYGTMFDFYRRGDVFDATDAQTVTAIRNRQVPQAVIVDAYNVANNQVLRAARGARIRNHSLDLDSRPQFNVRQAAARKDPNDIAGALANFQQLDAQFGNNLKCQSNSPRLFSF